MDREPCVYLLARGSHSTFYTGVTSNLIQRIHHHRAGTFGGFTRRWGIKRLVWFEAHDTMETAIRREKQIKRWPRQWKYDLIAAANPTWRDLAEELGFERLPLNQEVRQAPAQGRGDAK
ncbi:MAG: GIY-YIG nuclease family protein [Sphingomicrobium sp.]